MSKFDQDPQIIRLAGELGLSKRGNSFKKITQYALSKVEAILETFPVSNLQDLMLFISNSLSVTVEWIRSDEDIDRIIEEHSDFHSSLAQRLRLEFRESNTEGITLEREYWNPPKLRYLAVIDARGIRSSRAYFTAWHEIAHILIHPAQKEFPGFRRTPTKKIIEKDSLESLVDHISGHIAFYSPFFEPVITRELEHFDGLTFQAIEVAKNKIVPEASLYASTIQAINYYKKPALFLSVELGYKKKEERLLFSQQQSFDFAIPDIEPEIRVPSVIANEKAKEEKTFGIRRNMRVPLESILYKIRETLVDDNLVAIENQDWWETSSSGHLTSLPIKVEALKRGPYVYGLITTL